VYAPRTGQVHSGPPVSFIVGTPTLSKFTPALAPLSEPGLSSHGFRIDHDMIVNQSDFSDERSRDAEKSLTRVEKESGSHYRTVRGRKCRWPLRRLLVQRSGAGTP